MGDVVTSVGEVFGIAFIFAGTGIGNVKVGNMPVFDQVAEFRNYPEFFELAEALDGEDVRFIESVFLALFLNAGFAVGRFISDGSAFASGKIYEMPGFSRRPETASALGNGLSWLASAT